MLEASARGILEQLNDGQSVLDVGGGANPFPRADWVIDLMPYGQESIYEDPAAASTAGVERRFSADTWVCRDICDREPWPFSDQQFDFSVCSHTLEDVRDPVWVCSELVRVSAAGYIEVPSRLEEQSWGFQGPWVGWAHHRWLVDVDEHGIEFVFKHHIVHSHHRHHFSIEFHRSLSAEQRVQQLWWKGDFEYRERYFGKSDQLDAYLSSFVAENGGAGGPGDLARRRRLLSGRRSRS